MKKKINLITALIILVITLAGCNNNELNQTDASRFKAEYESLNDINNGDAANNLPQVSISNDNVIKYASFNDIQEILEKGTGVIYFGLPECPWCRNAVPVLLEAAETTGLDTIYYYNAVDIQDKKNLDVDGNIVTEEKEYQYIIEKLYDYLDVYQDLNDETIKGLYFPTVVFVYEGQVVDIHTGTVASQEDAYISLTDEQKNELKDIYIEDIHKVLNDICDEAC